MLGRIDDPFRTPPPAPPPAPGGGRFRRGYRIAVKSWSVIAADKSLLVLPLLSFVALGVAALLILGPTLLAARRDGTATPVLYGFAIAAYPFNLIGTFFGVAFVRMARGHLGGERTSPRASLAFAWSRIGPIAGWALIATLVGVAVQALERLRGGAIALRIAGWLLNAAWAIAVFFVIPVLASRPVGPIEAARESAAVVKRKWAEGVAGATVIGGVFGLMLMPAVVVGVIGWMSFGQSPTFGTIALVIAVAMFLAVSALQSAVDGMFRLALYDYAVDGTVRAPFDDADLAGGLVPKRRWLRRS